MEIKYLSASAIKDFLQCTLKFIYRSDRTLDDLKGDHAKLGIAVHTAIEQFTMRMQAKKTFPDQSDYEFAISTFMNSATEEGLEDMVFYKEGKQIVTSYIDRYDPNEKILDVEHFFRLQTPEGVPIVGAMDKVVVLNDNTLGIYDYKTAKRALTNNELLTDIQLSMYDLAASMIWPEYTNRVLFLDYVRLGKKISTYRTDEDRETFREFLKSVWLQISKLEEKEVTGSFNNFCGWCGYRTGCPTYQDSLKSRPEGFRLLSEMTDEEILAHWVEIEDKKAVIESRHRELKMLASHRFITGEGLSGNGQELYSTQASRTAYDIDDVANILPEKDLLTVLTVNKSKLDRYLKDNPGHKPSIDRIAKVSCTAPIFKIRRSAVAEDVEVEDTDQDEEAA